MSQTQDSNQLNGGLLLVRLYDNSPGMPGADYQCGAIEHYQELACELVAGSLEYYNLAGGQANKFLDHARLYIYAGAVPFPANPYNATCITTNDGNGWSHTDMFYPQFVGADYKLAGAFSHEMGHAYHNWCMCFGDSCMNGEWHRFWMQQFASNHSTDWNAYPWKRPNGAQETPYEGFANAFRYFKGTADTRGVSGDMNGGSDRVEDGFEDPANHREWHKQLNIMPETCAFMQRYGVQAGSLSWQGGQDGYFQFRRGDGTWVAQTDYDTWFEWVNGTWQEYSPTYNRF